MIRLALLLVLVACGPGVKGGPSMNNKIGGGDVEKPVSPVVSKDIIARDPIANKVEAKHILIGWKDVGRDGKPSDKRAMARTKADAEAEVTAIVEQLKANPAEYDNLMKAKSEDPGSAARAIAYTIEYNDMNFDSDFRLLAIRLHVDEIGVCESQFGFHIIKRIQ